MAQLSEIVGKEIIQQFIDLDKRITAVDENLRALNETIKANNGQLNKSEQSYKDLTNAKKTTVRATEELTEEEKQLEKIDQRLKASTDKVVKAKLEAAKASKEQKERIQQELTLQDKQVGTLNRLTAENKRLITERNKLNLETKEGQQRLREINAQLDKNNAAIKKNSSALEKQKINIGNYKSALQGIGTKLIGLAAAFGATIGAVETFKRIISSTQAVGDKFDQFIGGTRESFEFLARSISTLDFTNLISGFRNAYNEGKRYVAALDEIADRQRALGIQKLDIEGQILQQRIIAKNRALDIKDREAALEEIVRLETLKLDKTVELNTMALNNELENAAARSGMRKEEIADFVQNYDQYSAKISEGAALQAELDKLANAANTKLFAGVSPEGVAILQENTAAIDKYNKYFGSLNETQRENIRLNRLSSLITDEVRDKIGAALSANIQAQNEQTAGLELLVGLRNRLYRELIKGENDLQKARNKSLREDFDEQKLITKVQIEQQITDATLDNIQQRTDAEITSQDLILAGEKHLRDERLQAAGEILTATAQYFGELSAITDLFYQSQLTRLQNQKAYELHLAGDNADKRAKIEAEYDRKHAELQRKQAENEKIKALFDIAIRTATGIISALAMFPPNIPLSILVGITGAIQAGIVAATPIPQFYKGTESAPAGLISVGERGRELIQTKEGRMLMANEPAITAGLKGARIFSNPETEAILRYQQAGYDSGDLRRALEKNNRDLIKAIRNKREVRIERGQRVIGDRQGDYFKNYISRKIVR